MFKHCQAAEKGRTQPCTGQHEARCDSQFVYATVLHLEPVPEAAPPHMGPGPPSKGTMSGSSLSGGSRLKGARSRAAADALASESGVAGRCSRPRLTGWSHRVGLRRHSSAGHVRCQPRVLRVVGRHLHASTGAQSQ